MAVETLTNYKNPHKHELRDWAQTKPAIYCIIDLPVYPLGVAYGQEQYIIIINQFIQEFLCKRRTVIK